MHGRTVTDMSKQCIKLRQEGYSRQEIAQKVGTTPETVSGCLTRARRRGDLPGPPRCQSTRNQLQRAGLVQGSLKEVLDGLSPEQREWLIGEAVDLSCATAAEYVLEIIRDVHAVHVTPRRKAG